MSCETVSSNCQPELVYYTQEEMNEMADSLERLPKDDILIKCMINYNVLRKQVEACSE